MNAGGARAREAIIARLRSGLADSQPLFRSQEECDPIASVPSPVTSADGNGLALARTFGENLKAVLGTYEIADTVAEVPQRIVEQIGRWRNERAGEGDFANEVLSWSEQELPIPDSFGQLEKHGISLFVPSDLKVSDDRAHAASCAVGITSVDAAFAGTGSMVLVPGPGKSRAASLLPLHHIALVPVSRIFATLESWLAQLRNEERLEALFRDHAQLAFVTGPSKSADIELNLTLGVHGPRDVHAIIFDDIGS